MSVQQCVACQGTYATVQKDGSRYFHVCPSSIAPANVRNENIPSTDAGSAGKQISAGLGVQAPGAVPPAMTGLVGIATPAS